ncbi:hypothetical protein CCMA1212_005126, partial [Trichoderma ghanense]
PIGKVRTESFDRGHAKPSCAFLVDLCSRLYSAQKNGELCDLVLACNGQTIPVHKPIVCLQSPVIKAACTGPFVEASGTYEIKDCSFEAVQRMVEYLYTGDYQSKAADQGQTEEANEPVVHVTMFGLADMYLIDGLLTLAETKFRAAVKAEGIASVLLLHVRRVYDLQCDSSKVLREIMVEELRERITNINEFYQKMLQDLFAEIPEFAKDIATSFIQRPLTGRCPKCGRNSDRASLDIRNSPKPLRR